MSSLRKMAALLGALLPIGGAACDAAPPAAPPAPPSLAAAPVEPAVSVLASGHWSQVQACSGYCVATYHFWVDLKVRNDGYHKDVGIVWTHNDWAYTGRTKAVYEGPLEDGWERWGIDYNVGTMPTHQRPREIEFAAYAAMTGVTHWDPRNNHYIYNNVSAEAPVRLMSSEVHGEPGHEAVMTGRVRVFDLAFDKQVTVVWSTDGWETVHETDATWHHADDWDFRAEAVVDMPLPAEVAFAVRYTVDGQEHWDNNGGLDYRHALAPVLTPGYLFFDLDRPLSGNYRLGGGLQTELPLHYLHTRVDDGEWVEGSDITFSTLGLADGPHTIEVRATQMWGSEVSRLIDFTVANKITPVASWTPTQGADGGSAPLRDAWAMATASDGRVFVAPGGSSGDASRVMVYPSFGAAQVSAVYTLPDGLRARDLSVDASGRLYVVARGVTGERMLRLTADGALDPTFGAGGVVALEGPIAGEPLCYAGAVLGTDQGVYLADTCNHRVVRFTLAGVPDEALAIPADDTTIPAALVHASDGVWVAQAERLLRLSDDAAAPLSLLETIALEVRLANIAGLVRAADGVFWLTGGHADLWAVDSGGALLATWYGGDSWDLDGAFDVPQALQPLPDGDVVVLGAEGPIVARFATTLPD